MEPYEIHFRVAQEESFLLAAPYPNPFQTEVTFEVVVTGEESPSNQYVLQITDLQGRKVVELIADVSGMLIGTNRIRWNGSDAEGNRLPAGIFIYRILIRDGRSQHEYVGRIALSP